MRVLIISFITSTLLISCTPKIKNSNPEEFSQTLFKSFQENNFELAKQLILQPSDSNLILNPKDKIEFRNNYGTKSKYQIREDWVKDRFQKTYERGARMGIVWGKAKFERFQYELKIDDNGHKYLRNPDIYFTCNSRNYRVRVTGINKIGDKWIGFNSKTPHDIQAEDLEEQRRIEELAKTPYTPYGLGFTYANWDYKNESFTDFHVTLKNETKNDFDHIKYSVTIVKYKDGYKEEMFSRTYERNEKLYSGDVIRLQVPDLIDFYLGVDISNEDNFDWNAEIIDAKPRPK